MKRDERECKPKPLERLKNSGIARVGATDSIPAAPTSFSQFFKRLRKLRTWRNDNILAPLPNVAKFGVSDISASGTDH
jgi:hypothetical protein